MNLETERLQLKSIDERHVEDILKIRSNEIINQFIKRNSPKNNYDALQFILQIKENTKNNKTFYFGISLKNEPNLIGTICLWNFSKDRKTAEVGYELLPNFHGKGIMSEALREVLNFGFSELKLNQIDAFSNKNNVNSIQILEKFGFQKNDNRNDEDFPENIIFEKYI